MPLSLLGSIMIRDETIVEQLSDVCSSPVAGQQVELGHRRMNYRGQFGFPPQVAMKC